MHICVLSQPARRRQGDWEREGKLYTFPIRRLGTRREKFYLKDSKLTQVLRSFTPEELKSFEKFLNSPFFNHGRDLAPFFKILKSHYPDFTNKKFTAEHIYSKLYPGKTNPGNIKQMIKTLSTELINASKKFFEQVEFQKDLNHQNYYRCNQLRLRKLYKDFEKEYKCSLEQQKNSDNGGIRDFIEKYFLNSVFRDYSLDRDNFVNAFEATLQTDENIVSAAMMICFMFEDMKNISTGYNLPLRYTLMNNVIESIDSERLLSEMKKNNDRFYPYVLIFYMIYKMNKHKERREYFYELKKLLIEYRDLFGQSENYVFWSILLSYCSANGISKKEFIAIYDHILENNIYKKSAGEDFHIILFRNIINVMTIAGKFEWLENFIEKYSKELHIDHRENMYNFSYAHVNFAKGNFETALEYISKVSYDVFLFKIDVRVLLLKTYYELSYFEEAYSLIDSSLHFLKNSSAFSDFLKITYRAFVQHLREILKIKFSEKIDPHALTFLEKKIREESTYNAGQTEWLLMKIAGMKEQLK